MNKLFTLVSVAVFIAATGQAVAETYDLSGTFVAPGGFEASLGGENIVDSGSIVLSGSVTTDTDLPGYAITGGSVSVMGLLSVLGGSGTIEVDMTGTASDAGVLFDSGSLCVTLGPVNCDGGLIDISIDNFDFRAGALWQSFAAVGIQLTGGAGGTDFSVAQPGNIATAGLGGAVGGAKLAGADAGFFMAGDITFSIPPPPPNIVLIQLDTFSMDAMQTLLDGGWLPNISTHLVDAGVSFQNSFVTNTESSASRASTLTGQYAHNHVVLADHALNPLKGAIAYEGWLPENGQPGREDSTVANWLQDAGYRTGFIGKYLSGYGEQAPTGVVDPRTYVPSGWNTWNGLLSPSTFRVYDYDMNENGVVVHYGVQETDYQTDVLAGQAAGFIADPAANPFFLMVAPLAPHVEVLDLVDLVTGNDPLGGFGLGIRPALRHSHLVDGDEGNGELPSLQVKPSFNEADVSGKPSCPRPAPPIEPALISDPACVAERPLFVAADTASLTNQYKSMLASVIAVDDMVGSVIDSLGAAGKLDNTAIIFTSGSGWSYGEHRLIGKDLAYEESIRVPFIMRAPGGKTLASSSAIILNNDIAPTLAELAGITPPYQPDGSSIMPLVEIAPDTSWLNRKRFLVERWYLPSLLKFDGPTYLAMRQLSATAQGLIYIASRTDPSQFSTVTHHELYDIASDPYQLENITLSDSVTASLDSFLMLFRSCSGDTCKTLESF